MQPTAVTIIVFGIVYHVTMRFLELLVAYNVTLPRWTALVTIIASASLATTYFVSATKLIPPTKNVFALTIGSTLISVGYAAYVQSTLANQSFWLLFAIQFVITFGLTFMTYYYLPRYYFQKQN